jgi:hypothetical protein
VAEIQSALSPDFETIAPVIRTGSDPHSRGTTRRFLCAVLLVLTVNTVSAALFIRHVHRPVYDDVFNIYDVHAYATKGISVASIQAQRNPPGPTSFIWMSLAVRLLGHDELLDGRVAALLSWLILATVTIIFARYTTWPQLWYGAFLAALVFPHALTASASLLTEGPGLLFGLFGVAMWIEAVPEPREFKFRSLGLAIAGGLSMGFAVTCRQYYLALLPSAGLTALLLLKARPSGQKLRWMTGVICSLAAALIPVVLLVLVWHGITSPSMASGASYSNYQAGVGVAWFRPIVVIFYTLLYLVPFSFPAMFRLSLPRFWPALLASALVGVLATHFRTLLLDPGPLHSLVQMASRIPAGDAIIFGLIASITTYNAIAVSSMLWGQRSRLLSCPPAIFSLLVVIFFVLEQIGVGGNIPFYDRYILQIVPFLGLLGFWLFPKLTYSRILALAGLSIVGQFMLWRYAFLPH